MSIFRKLELAFIALLLLGLAGLSGYAYYQSTRIASLSTDYSLSNGRAGAAETALSETTKLNDQRAQSNAELDQALAENAEWSVSPIPPAVADRLRHPSGAARAVPE